MKWVRCFKDPWRITHWRACKGRELALQQHRVRSRQQWPRERGAGGGGGRRRRAERRGPAASYGGQGLKAET
eukprot:2837464-Prorocentrum_lima.AAC.1